jgi:hypothetical protein
MIRTDDFYIPSKVVHRFSPAKVVHRLRTGDFLPAKVVLGIRAVSLEALPIG